MQQLAASSLECQNPKLGFVFTEVGRYLQLSRVEGVSKNITDLC